jgi:hypothetical protein
MLSSARMVEAVSTSEKSVNYRATGRCNPEDSNLRGAVCSGSGGGGGELVSQNV